MECPSELHQPQRPHKPGATAPGTSEHSGVGGQMTSGSSGEPSLMEGRAGDGSSWFEQVTHEEARQGACKRKRVDTDQQAPGRPFPLRSEEARKEAMGAIYEHTAGQEPPQRNITSRAISAYYPNFTPAAVKTVASQVLCMIAEYHLACATRAPQPPALSYLRQLNNICLHWWTMPIRVAQALPMCGSASTRPAACMYECGSTKWTCHSLGRGRPQSHWYN